MQNRLENKKIAVLATDGVECLEISHSIESLIDEEAEVDIVSLRQGQIRSWNRIDWGESYPVNIDVSHADSDIYDALLLPGGLMNSDSLRVNDDAIAFVRSFVKEGKPIAAIGHGVVMLIETDAIMNRTVTSSKSLKTDIKNAGGNWIDEEVVVDEGIITSRKPDDIYAFEEKMVEEFTKEARLRIK